MSVRENIDELAEFFPDLVEMAEAIMVQAGGSALRIMRVVDLMPEIIFCGGPDLSGLEEREIKRSLRRHDPELGRMTTRVVEPIASRVARATHRRG